MACAIFATPLYAQETVDLSGAWSGVLLQNEGGFADKFELYFNIEQIGPSIKGKAYVRLGELMAEMKLKGHLTPSGSWSIAETKILRNNKAGMAVSWCMKQYELRVDYRRGELVLTGPWWGDSEYGPCIPGSVTLKRRTKKIAGSLLGGEHPVDIEPHG